MTDISIIILSLNEEKFIREILKTVLVEDGLVKEIIVADAGSSDNTPGYIVRQQQVHPEIIIFENKERYVSKALNKIVPMCKGNYIAVLGAHTVYPQYYIQTAVSFLQNHPEYSIVGGPIDHAAESLTGKSIAFCMSSPFGMGNSAFRTTDKDMETDSVPFPVYHKKVFEKLNGYDNRLIRNQDEDFHYRAVQSGFRIYMLSALRSVYYVRESYTRLIKQFFQYGYFKPLVMKKNKQSVKLRHFIPLFFTLYLVFSILSMLLFDVSPFLLYPIVLYIIIDIVFSISLKVTNPLISLFNLITFPIMHLSYGAGTLTGLFKTYK